MADFGGFIEIGYGSCQFEHAMKTAGGQMQTFRRFANKF